MTRTFFIVGPTATGKSEIAVDVAREVGAEIVSGDAFQIYRCLDLVTANPESPTLSKATNHLIGTGRNATPAQAQEAHAFIRHILREMSDDTTADRIRIQYGGSVKPENARELMSQPDIDGALVGGASLDPRSFAKIVKAAREE